MMEATTVADRVEQVAAALRSHNIEGAIVVETGAEARDVVLGLIPDGAEVHSGKSKTLEDIGLVRRDRRIWAVRCVAAKAHRDGPGDAGWPRCACSSRLRTSCSAAWRRSRPTGRSSRHRLLAASAAPTSRARGPSDPRGRQPEARPGDLEAALRRIREVVFPWENDRVRERLGVDTRLEKVLLILGESQPGSHNRRARPRAGCGLRRRTRKAADANLLLWIGQILLAMAFLVDFYIHTVGFDTLSVRPGMTWLADVGRDRMRAIGVLEGLGAIGLVLPAATGILPWLTPVAATCLAILMVFAAVFHLRRPGEAQNVVLNVFLGVSAVLVAYGQFVVAR